MAEKLPAPEIAKLTDAEVAALLVKEMFGETVTVTKPPASKQVYDAEGTFSLGGAPEYAAWCARRDKLLEKMLRGGPDEVSRRCRTVCEQAGVGKQCDPTHSNTLCRSTSKFKYTVPYPLNHQVLLEAVAPLLPPADLRRARERVALSYGHERQVIQIKRGYDTLYSAIFEPTPLERWKRRDLKLALSYAKAQGLDAEQNLEAALAQAPEWRCSYEPTMMTQDYEGGGRYGKVAWYPRGLVPGPDNADWWGEVPCDKVPKAKAKGAEYLKILKAAERTENVLSVAMMPSQSWEVLKLANGTPERKLLIVRMYSRQEW